MFRAVLFLCAEALDRAGYFLTCARLGILDRLAGSPLDGDAPRGKSQQTKPLSKAASEAELDPLPAIMAEPLPLADQAIGLGSAETPIDARRAALPAD